MTTLDAIAAAQRRPGVQVYTPGRALPAALGGNPPQAARPVQPVARAAPTPTASSWGELTNKYLSSPENQRKQEEDARKVAEQAQKKAQSEAAANRPFWQKALGYVIAPLQPLSVPMKVVDFAMEEGVKWLPDKWEEWMSHPFGKNAKGFAKVLNEAAPLMGGLFGQDMAKTHDDQSWWDRLKPSSSYGAGEIYGNDISTPGLTGLRNLILDIEHDPLTYLTAGAGKAVEVGARAGEAASAARVALEEAPKFLDEAGKVANPAIKDLEEALAQAEKRASKLGDKVKIKDLPHARQERMGMISELAMSGPEGEAAVKEFANEFSKGVDQGFTQMNQGAKDALGVTKSGLRLRGTEAVIPGTGKLAEVMNLPGKLGRVGMAGLTDRLGESSSTFLNKLGEGRVPVRLGEHYKTVRSQSASADEKFLALAKIHAENVAHTTENIVEGGAKNVANMTAKPIRKMSAAERKALVVEAQVSPEANVLNNGFLEMAKVYADATGRPIEDVVMRDSATHVPHIQTGDWLDFRNTLDEQSKKDWDNLTGISTQDTLKTSGHMDKRRVLELGPNGEPKSFKIGNRMVEVTDDTLDGLNDAFAKAFPEFKGQVYETDPFKLLAGYQKAVAQSSRKWSLNKLGTSGTSLATTMTGALDAERQAINEAERLRSPEARLAEAANQPRVPGQRAPEIPRRPIVPGSPEEQVNRAFNEQLPELQARATTLEQQQQLDELAQRHPAPTNPEPSGMFVRQESRTGQAKLAEQLLSPEAIATEEGLRTEAVATAEASQRTLGDLRDNLFADVRKDAKTVDKQLDRIDKGIQSYRTQLEGFRSVRSNNPEQVEQMLKAVTKNVMDLEAELAQKQATWKGLGTKAANKAERKLKDQFEQLKTIRDEVRTHLDDATGQRIATEVDKRTELLLAPVRAAQERVAAKTLSIAAPYKQAALNEASDVLERAGMGAEHWQAYNDVIAARPRNTPLATGTRISVEEQRALDMAAHRITGGEVTPYIEAQGRATALQNMLPDATTAQARRMREELAAINKEFAPGGKYFAERKARGVMARQLEHEQAVSAATARERATLERARQQVETRQEAIVRDAAGNRVLSDSAGLAEGTPRKITPIQNTPQVEATQDVYPGTRGAIKPLPPQRTEREAIAAVAAQADPGSEVHAARVEATTQAVADFEANMPTMTGEVRAAALRDIGQQADVVLGPISAELGTMRGLATDLGNKQQLLARRAVNENLLNRLEKAAVGKADLPKELLAKARQLQLVIRQNPRLDDLSLAATESLLHNEVEQLTLAAEKLQTAGALSAAQAAARKGDLPKIFVAAVHDGWVTLHGGLATTGDTLIDKQLYDSFMRITEAVNEPKLFTRTFNNLTNLWKTYATLSPGFHVRNGLGGIFMNLSDGVGFRHQLEAVEVFKALRSGGREWLAEQPERIKQAVAAMYASGAGGQFEEAGMRSGLANNFVARASRRGGEWVEGPLRLAMGLHSYDRGDTLMQAYERINRIHFDYSRISSMDESMKRIVPFWTFMSRNLPLQMTQMWTKPTAYAYYGSVKRNFSVPNDPLTPEYWGKLGAWNTGKTFRGMPLYLDPDFGFNRVEADVGNVIDAVAGGNPGALLSNVNPLLSAPADFLMKRDSFYDRSFKPTDFSEQSGVTGGLLKAVASLVPGQTNEAGQVSDNFTNLVSSLIPLYDRTNRLTGQNDPQRTPESWARFFGAPIRTLSDKQQEAAALSKYLDAQAERKRVTAMQREAS